ncbi:hypothetical protein LIER_01997 [Lithospermum erythrorhizon]|uniref:Uncharacterized protein n=1 Tax=Lithospermum erythrorhizon TaxID=34254 RepID=A0AAV3NMV8_LITER
MNHSYRREDFIPATKPRGLGHRLLIIFSWRKHVSIYCITVKGRQFSILSFVFMGVAWVSLKDLYPDHQMPQRCNGTCVAQKDTI